MPKVAAFMPDADEVLGSPGARIARSSSSASHCITGVSQAKFSPARDLAQQARMKRMFKKGAIKAETMIIALLTTSVVQALRKPADRPPRGPPSTPTVRQVVRLGRRPARKIGRLCRERLSVPSRERAATTTRQVLGDHQPRPETRRRRAAAPPRPRPSGVLRGLFPDWPPAPGASSRPVVVVHALVGRFLSFLPNSTRR